MTQVKFLNRDRLEDLARQAEEFDFDEGVDMDEVAAAFAINCGFGYDELLAVLAELIASRRMAETGGGMIVTQKGSITAHVEKGFSRTLKFKFLLKLGSPTGNVTEGDLDEMEISTLQKWGQSLRREIVTMKAELRERAAREEREKAEGRNVREFPKA